MPILFSEGCRVKQDVASTLRPTGAQNAGTYDIEDILFPLTHLSFWTITPGARNPFQTPLGFPFLNLPVESNTPCWVYLLKRPFFFPFSHGFFTQNGPII